MPHRLVLSSFLAALILGCAAGSRGDLAGRDAQGMYRVSLRPGTYRVTMSSLTGVEFTKDLPATVAVTAGQETRLDIRIDTGIR